MDEAVGSNVKCRLGARPDQTRLTDCGITTGGGGSVLRWPSWILQLQALEGCQPLVPFLFLSFFRTLES